MTMKQLLTLLTLLWLCAGSLSAQQKGNVSLQAALNDSTFLNVKLAYSCADKGSLTLQKAYLTRRGQLRQSPVSATNLRHEFDQQPTVSFSFSLDFIYDQRRYRAKGHYEDGPNCRMRVAPLGLSKRTLLEGEY
jgi:hypothetical protein